MVPRLRPEGGSHQNGARGVWNVATETLSIDIAPLVDDYIESYGSEGTLRISIGINPLDYVL